MQAHEWALIGVVIGGILGLANQLFLSWLNNKRVRAHNASILYYDLDSIMRYTVNILSVPIDVKSHPNIRYDDKWQERIANCTFIKDEHVRFLYELYDAVYDFNFAFKAQPTLLNTRKQHLRDVMVRGITDFNDVINLLDRKRKRQPQSGIDLGRV